MDALSVQETYFWREIEQIQGFVAGCCRRSCAPRPQRPIRIWSVPCATGEEPLTIAMALNEAGWFDRAGIKIHASDASSAAIAKARLGAYRERSFRALPPALREKYSSATTARGVPVPELRERIASWSVVNLMRPEEIAPLRAQSGHFLPQRLHLFFARRASGQWLMRFADRMPAPSYLFVGASESLLNVTNRFMLEDLEEAFVYVKR